MVCCGRELVDHAGSRFSSLFLLICFLCDIFPLFHLARFYMALVIVLGLYLDVSNVMALSAGIASSCKKKLWYIPLYEFLSSPCQNTGTTQESWSPLVRSNSSRFVECFGGLAVHRRSLVAQNQGGLDVREIEEACNRR